jgi:molybdopterin/thiamine biosynthesis adenylyltransferase
MLKKLEEEVQEEIDVEYDKKNIMGTGKEIDINDEKVKDRWSRYIGAMGIDAVSKQSKADILVFGLGPMALEVIKNLVLSGCRRLTIVDEKDVRYEDLSGGFFYNEADIGKKRLESILYKIRELNIYVKTDTLPLKDVT